MSEPAMSASCHASAAGVLAERHPGWSRPRAGLGRPYRRPTSRRRCDLVTSDAGGMRVDATRLAGAFSHAGLVESDAGRSSASQSGRTTSVSLAACKVVQSFRQAQGPLGASTWTPPRRSDYMARDHKGPRRREALPRHPSPQRGASTDRLSRIWRSVSAGSASKPTPSDEHCRVCHGDDSSLPGCRTPAVANRLTDRSGAPGVAIFRRSLGASVDLDERSMHTA
jgi:hypothetical protein